MEHPSLTDSCFTEWVGIIPDPPPRDEEARESDTHPQEEESLDVLLAECTIGEVMHWVHGRLRQLSPEELLCSLTDFPMGYRLTRGRSEEKIVEFFTGDKPSEDGETTAVMPRHTVRATASASEILAALPPGIRRGLELRLRRAKNLQIAFTNRIVYPLIKERKFWHSEAPNRLGELTVISRFIEGWEDRVIQHACKCGGDYDTAISWHDFCYESDKALDALDKSLNEITGQITQESGATAEDTIDPVGEPPDSLSGGIVRQERMNGGRY